jgi:cytochrome P450
MVERCPTIASPGRDLDDPYPLYAELRAEAPVHLHGGSAVVVDYATARAVFHDTGIDGAHHHPCAGQRKGTSVRVGSPGCARPSRI